MAACALHLLESCAVEFRLAIRSSSRSELVDMWSIHHKLRSLRQEDVLETRPHILKNTRSRGTTLTTWTGPPEGCYRREQEHIREDQPRGSGGLGTRKVHGSDWSKAEGRREHQQESKQVPRDIRLPPLRYPSKCSIRPPYPCDGVDQQYRNKWRLI